MIIPVQKLHKWLPAIARGQRIHSRVSDGCWRGIQAVRVVWFLEVKRPKGGRVAKHQRMRHDAYIALGAKVAVVESLADVDRLLGGGVHKVPAP